MRWREIPLMILAAVLAWADRPAAADTLGSGPRDLALSSGFFFRLPPPRAAPGIASQANMATSAAADESCRQAIALVEKRTGLPDHLLAAIGRVETGRRDSRGGVSPWPWSINVEGVDHVYDTKAEAIAAVTGYQARGVRSIDVGCLQVNLMYHPTAFDSLGEAFDPLANATYAAKFLTQLYAQSGSWERATALYHSATPGVGESYQRKVEAALPEERQLGAPPVSAAVAPQLAMASGPGPIMLGSNAPPPRILLAPPGTVGRGLDFYRNAAVPVARRARM
jgi:hypothetical protein